MFQIMRRPEGPATERWSDHRNALDSVYEKFAKQCTVDRNHFLTRNAANVILEKYSGAVARFEEDFLRSVLKGQIWGEEHFELCRLTGIGFDEATGEIKQHRNVYRHGANGMVLVEGEDG